MSRKKDKKSSAAVTPRQPNQQPQPMMYYGPMGNGINPVAMPSRFIQLTPIIQPIAMVPFSTQQQPLAMYDGSFEDDDF